MHELHMLFKFTENIQIFGWAKQIYLKIIVVTKNSKKYHKKLET